MITQEWWQYSAGVHNQANYDALPRFYIFMQFFLPAATLKLNQQAYIFYKGYKKKAFSQEVQLLACS